MVISESGLCAAMKSAYGKKSSGYKVALRCLPDREPELVISTPEWIVLLDRENAPRKVLALIVEHLGELPTVGKGFHVKAEEAQAEIFKMAIPVLPELVEEATARRTQIAFMNHTIYQRQDNHVAYMIHPRLESLLDNKIFPLSVAENGMLFLAGVASRIYIRPYEPMHAEMAALKHLAKYQWT